MSTIEGRAVAEDSSALRERVRELEQQVLDATALWTALAANSRDIILFIRESDGRIVEANEAASVYGYSREQLLTLTIRDLRAPESLGNIEAQLTAAASSGALFETTHMRADGSRFPVEVNSTAATVDGIRLLISIVRDCSQRARAEVARMEAAERLRQAMHVAHLGIWDWDITTDRTSWYGEMFRLYGITPEAFTGRGADYIAYTREDYRAAQVANIEQALKRGVTEEQLRAGVELPNDPKELCIVRPDGSEVFTLGDAIVIVAPDGRPLRMLGVTTDITERKRADERLRRSEAALLEAERVAKVGHWTWDTRENRVTWSEEMKRIWGLDPATVEGDLSEIITQRVHPDDRAAVAASNTAVVERRSPSTLQYRILVPGVGERVILAIPGRTVTDGNGNILQLNGVVQDVTDIRRAEAERLALQESLTHAQKMESVGRLAGGVAHDFNNMLGVILGHAELALRSVPPGDRLHLDLTEIRKAARRSADLTRQLLAFARKQSIRPVVLHLNDAVATSLRMLRRLLGESIELIWQPGAALYPVLMDPTQLDQVLANLCVNARDAIGDVGTLTISTANVTLDESQAALYPEGMAGQYVRLRVTDTGTGMDEETLARIFEPFFTTKDVGAGTGLGLSTVYGAIRQSDGFVGVTSALGAGTTFDIFLPRSAAAAMHEQHEDVDASSVRGHGTILVVEDEPAILNLTVRALEEYGYRVLKASSPGEARQVAAAADRRIDLLLTDVVMPTMSGRALARELIADHPHLRVLFMSGYASEQPGGQSALEPGLHFLAKPFSLSALHEKVAQVLKEEVAAALP